MFSNKHLDICFINDSLRINLYDNPVSDYVYGAFKHLKNVPLSFNDVDFFFNQSVNDFTLAQESIIKYAQDLSIDIDSARLNDQLYLNHLHEIYEKNFNGQSQWLKFHEHIHIIETIVSKDLPDPIIAIDYRTLAGKVKKSFNREYYKYSTSLVKKNQCFICWQELGKTPYYYYLTNEANDITRLCELAKPWITLRPSFYVACDDIDFLDGINFDSFDAWFAPFKHDWCSHWQITDWNSAETFKVIPIGEITSADDLVNNIKNNNLPIKVIQ
jgi:hypothetical protein